MTSSFTNKGRTAVLDWPAEISCSEINKCVNKCVIGAYYAQNYKLNELLRIYFRLFKLIAEHSTINFYSIIKVVVTS